MNNVTTTPAGNRSFLEKQERSSNPRWAGSSVTSPTDHEIINRCKLGDKDAWNLLVARYIGSINKFAHTFARNNEDAADITSQVLIRVYENIHTFRNNCQFSSWLYCIVRNAYVDICVRAHHRSDVSLDDGLDIDGDRVSREIPDSAPTPEARCLDRERNDMLSNIISHLPPYQRNIVMMYHVDSLTYEEIAARTGLSLGTVKSRLSRARTMLRSRMEGLESIFIAG
jgi:RNA polymerase sigma-70 factor (ECF subfamily)